MRRTSTGGSGSERLENSAGTVPSYSAKGSFSGGASRAGGHSGKKALSAKRRGRSAASGKKGFSRGGEKGSGFPIALTGRALIYPFLVVAALMLAQSLKQPVSHMAFVFVLLMPLAAVVQLIAAVISIRTAVRVSAETVQKNAVTGMRVIVSNSGPIPFPFVEAVVLRQDKHGVCCVPEYVGVSLPPFAGCEISRNLSFAFRGVYYPGLERMWVYDYFRMIRLRIDVHMLTGVYVVPRRLELQQKKALYDIDEETDANRSRPVGEDSEPNDLRAYINGDSLKRIHWKLSSKSQELVVKNFSGNTGKRVYILCDLEARYKNRAVGGDAPEQVRTLREPLPEYAEVIDESMADLVIENALAAAKRELRADSLITLVWLEERDGHPIPRTAQITCREEYENAFHALAGVSLTPFAKQTETLLGLLPDVDESALIVVTSCVDPGCAESCAAVSRAQLTAGGSTELIFCRDDSLFAAGDTVGKDEDERLTALGTSGRLTRGIVSVQDETSDNTAAR